MEDITPNTLPEEPGVSSPSGEGAAPNSSEGNEEITDIKDVIGETLGKTYDTNEAALKSVKDTFDHVGSQGQKIKDLEAKVGEQKPTEVEKPAEAKPTDTSNLVPKDEYERNRFFDRNQEYDTPEYRQVIESLVSTTGQSIKEVVESDAFKPFYEKAQKFDQDEKAKSVLQTNPRLGQITDKGKEAQESLAEMSKAVSSGDHNAAEQYHGVATDKAMGSVMEAMEPDA